MQKLWRIQDFPDGGAGEPSPEYGAKSYLLLPPANEVWGKVMFSETSVCHSVHRGGGGLPTHPPPMQTPLGSPPPLDTMGYGQQAAGVHPTGMHSCLARSLPNTA